jgi:hypothetical protein
MYDVAGEEQLENEQDPQPVSSIISNDEDQSETSPTPQSQGDDMSFNETRNGQQTPGRMRSLNEIYD